MTSIGRLPSCSSTIFTRRLFAWCDARGVSLTGHQNENEGEDDLAWQIGSCGAVMPHYEYMHIPGIDHLNCRWAGLREA